MLSACSGGAPAELVSACDLPQYPQRTVRVDTTIGVERDGRVMLIDAKCPSIHIPLQLTGRASGTDLAAQMKSAGGASTDPSAMRVSAQMTGVYTGDSTGVRFTADTLTARPPAKP
jgi:hypothetical protein